MSDREWIEPIVERVVGQVLDAHGAQLRAEIVRRVSEEIAAQPASAPASGGSGTNLARAVADIQLGTSQKEILRALLDSCSRYAARTALFVVKGTNATGWQARGFVRSDAVKDFAVDPKAPALVRAITERAVCDVRAEQFDTHFFEEFGSPSSGEGRLLPLMLKDKVAALVYADAGSSNDAALLDAGALEVLVLATGAWLEVNALRKNAHKDSSAAHAESHSAAAPAPPFNDPFASHAPAFAMAAAASADSSGSSAADSAHNFEAPGAEGQLASVEVQSAAAVAVAAEPLAVGHVETASVPASDFSTSSMSPEDQEVHRKAQRFARLLVDEIKLYNQVKVTEGRKNHDLYDRLKDTIDKSRTTYQKRYGKTVAASGNYFDDEVKRSLAEDDLSIMGPNFRM
jgi:hypothetical protein